jgi:osmotically-inducible protein OsmY
MIQVASPEPVTLVAARHLNGSHQKSTMDFEVSETAAARLRASPYFPLRSITCEFEEGTLLLSGCVTSYYLKQLAQETVRTLQSVRVIVNAVQVIQR